MGSSIASILVPTEKIVIYMRERAKRASASKTYIFRSQNTSAYIQSMQFPFITYGMALYTTVYYKTLLIEKIYEYASERSERA